MKKAKVTKDQLFELIQKVAEEAANATGTGATFTPGTGEQYATPKASKKKVKESNTSAPFKKGFKHGTHPESKAMDYKQLYEIEDDYYQPEEQDDDEDNYDWYTNSYTEESVEFESGDKVKILPGAGFMRPGGVTGEVHDSNEDGTYSVLIDAPGRPMKNIKADYLQLMKKAGEEPVTDYGRYRQDPSSYEKDYQQKGTSDYFRRRGLYEIDVQNGSTDEILTYLQAAKQNGTLSPDAQEVFLQWINTPGASREEIVRVLRKLTGTYINEEFKPGKEFINIKLKRYPQALSKVNNLISMIGENNFTIDMAQWIFDFFNNASYESPVNEKSLNENYSQFRNETKTRSKPEQFHQAVKAVKKRVQEINKLFEYVSRLKTELSEDKDGLKYKAHTEKAIGQIKEMVLSLNQNIRKFK